MGISGIFWRIGKNITPSQYWQKECDWSITKLLVETKAMGVNHVCRWAFSWTFDNLCHESVLLSLQPALAGNMLFFDLPIGVDRWRFVDEVSVEKLFELNPMWAKLTLAASLTSEGCSFSNCLIILWRRKVTCLPEERRRTEMKFALEWSTAVAWELYCRGSTLDSCSLFIHKEQKLYR